MASSSAYAQNCRRDLVLLKTYEAFQDRLEYAKAKDGSWTVEFHGRFHVRAEDPSLDRCRHRALSELDKQLAAWVARPSRKAGKPKGEKKQRKN
jgi:hypothetical protein